jgi:hypothetical protein
MVEIRIPDHPETGEERWRLAGVTGTKQLLVCLEQTDADFDYEGIQDVKRGEDVWCYRAYWPEPDDNGEGPKAA